MRTVKEEEVDLEEYRTFREAKQAIGRFIEEVYPEGFRDTRRWDTGRRVSSRRSSPPAFFIRCVSQAQGVDTCGSRP